MLNNEDPSQLFKLKVYSLYEFVCVCVNVCSKGQSKFLKVDILVIVLVKS